MTNIRKHASKIMGFQHVVLQVSGSFLFFRGNVFQPNKDLVLRSEDDEEMLIVLRFKAQVRIRAIDFIAPNNAGRPTTVKFSSISLI